MWTYHQRSGLLLDRTGRQVARGYAGNGQWKNDPSQDHVPKHGPLPRGRYTIGPPEPGHGGYTLRLHPDPTNVMHGRSGFLIHADMADPALRGQASEGCIILPRPVRMLIWASDDHDLLVLE